MNDVLIKTALVIPVHNRKKITLQCLRSLARIDMDGLDVHIFIVDDGSTDGTSDAIRSEFPNVEIIHGDGTLHYAAGINRGIEAALKWDPEFIVIMNDDAVFHEQFLQRLMRTARQNPRSVVGALLLLWDEPHKVFQVGLNWHTLQGGWQVPKDLTAFAVPGQPFEAECIVGNCVLLPTEAFHECGLMDEVHFQQGWGDVQYTTKMRKMGWKLLVDTHAYVWCEPNTYPQPLHQLSLRDSLKILFIDERHPANLKRQLVARWYSAPSKPKALAAFGVYCAMLAKKVFVYGFRNMGRPAELEKIPDPKMRQIIYVWNYREWGGAQIYFMSLMKEAKNEYLVTALLPSDSEPKILQYLNALEIPYEFLDPAPSIKRPNGLLARTSNRWTLLRSENGLANKILARDGLSDTIVHIDLGFWQSLLPLGRLCMKTNVFMTVHTGLPRYKGWRKLRWKIKGKIISRFSNFHLLASNQEAKDRLRPYLGSAKFDQIGVTYSGIDPIEIARVTEDRPAKADVRQRYGLPSDRPVLMTVGQFIERKGCWVLLESLKGLKDAGKDFAFVWLSTTMTDAETMKKIGDYGLSDSFRLMDSDEIGETRGELLTLLSVADIFVLASFQEGLPIALIEAMALGLPCIATSVNAIPEAIEDGQTGMLVKPNDPNDLQVAITALLNDPQQRAMFGAAAKKIAFEKFNAKITADRTMKLYEEVWKTNA